MTVCCHVDLCGADLSMLTVLKGLKEHGYQIVVLLTRHGRIEENLRNLKIEYYIIPQNGCITNRTINQTYFLPRKIYNWLFFLKHEILCDIKLYRFIKSFPSQARCNLHEYYFTYNRNFFVSILQNSTYYAY